MHRLVLAVGFALALGAGAAIADERKAAPEANAETVRFTDLNLNATEDVATLLTRLEHASARACEAPELARPSAAARRMMEACRADAMENAVARVNHPQLTLAYAERRR